MNDAMRVQVAYGGGQLGHVKSHNVFRKRAQSLQVDLGEWIDKRKEAGNLKMERRTAQITSQHKVQDEETVLVILESVSHVYNKGVVDL